MQTRTAFLLSIAAGRIQMVNSHMEKLFGYRQNELLGLAGGDTRSRPISA